MFSHDEDPYSSSSRHAATRLRRAWLDKLVVDARTDGRCSALAMLLVFASAAASPFPERSETCHPPNPPLRPLPSMEERSGLRFSPSLRPEEAIVIIDVSVAANGSVASARITCHTAAQRGTLRAALQAVRGMPFTATGSAYEGEMVIEFAVRD